MQYTPMESTGNNRARYCVYFLLPFQRCRPHVIPTIAVNHPSGAYILVKFAQETILFPEAELARVVTRLYHTKVNIMNSVFPFLSERSSESTTRIPKLRISPAVI